MMAIRSCSFCRDAREGGGRRKGENEIEGETEGERERGEGGGRWFIIQNFI